MAGKGPDPHLHPLLTQMALMSDSWPVKVCRHIPSRTSQSLAEASQAPETNSLVSGARERLITSPVCPVNVVVCWPVSMSHRALQQEQRISSDLALSDNELCEKLSFKPSRTIAKLCAFFPDKSKFYNVTLEGKQSKQTKHR